MKRFIIMHLQERTLKFFDDIKSASLIISYKFGCTQSKFCNCLIREKLARITNSNAIVIFVN